MQKPKSIWDYPTNKLCVENSDGETVLLAELFHSRDYLLRTVQEWADRLDGTLYIRAAGDDDDFVLVVPPQAVDEDEDEDEEEN